MMIRGLCAVTVDDLLLPRLSALVKAALDGGTPFVSEYVFIEYSRCTAPLVPYT